MKAYILLLIIAAVFYSCKEDITRQNQELIIGEWAPIDDDSTYNIASIAGYLFEKEYCENKIGFYEYFNKNGPLIEYPSVEVDEEDAYFCRFHDIYDYLYNVKNACGYRTIYKIEKDTLQIFDLADKRWVKYQIRFSSKDTLFLSNRYSDKNPDRFVRKIYKTDNQPLIDEFVFYYPPSCTSHSKCYLIRRDGFFFSYGYFKANRFLIGWLQDDAFIRLETLFKKGAISTILSQWDSLKTQKLNRNVKVKENVSFVRNQQLTTVKSNSLYFWDKSVESYWAYLSGLFLPDLAYVKPLNARDYPDLLDEFDDFFSIDLKSQDRAFGLPPTERFYLGVLLCYAEKVEGITFNPTYTMTGLSDKNKTMQTDGRYFRYTDWHGREITLDIGFNFIEVNGLDQ